MRTLQSSNAVSGLSFMPSIHRLHFAVFRKGDIVFPVPAFPILKDKEFVRTMRIPQAENVGARIGIMIRDS